MNVVIHGPNLRDQSKGQFHVHSANCTDNKKYGRGKKMGGDDEGWTIDVDNKVDVVITVYDNQLDENPDVKPEEWLDDFHFAPCVNLK